jgi:hypothetical protein
MFEGDLIYIKKFLLQQKEAKLYRDRQQLEAAYRKVGEKLSRTLLLHERVTEELQGVLKEIHKMEGKVKVIKPRLSMRPKMTSKEFDNVMEKALALARAGKVAEARALLTA